MDVTSTLKLPADDQKELARILDCDPKDLPKILAPYASAALTEVVTMFLGQKVFSRGSDMLEYRLLLLIQHAFKSQIPDEQRVCRLFQTTASGSRSLIRSVMSKYQYQLKSAIEKSIKLTVESARKAQGETEYSVVINSLNLVEELNRLLAEIDGNLPQINKKHASVSTYEIAASSYSRLCERLSVAQRNS